VNNHKECDRIKKELENNNTEILVFGDTCSGKSLFLNLLLGKELLSTTQLNCTSAITKVIYDKKIRIRARKTNFEKLKDRKNKALEEANKELNKQALVDKVINNSKSSEKSKKKYEYEWVEKDLSNVSNLEESIRSFLKASKENVYFFFLNSLFFFYGFKY
jgi:hypothetical protein